MLAEWEEKLDGWKFGKFATMDVNEIEAVAGQFAKRVYKLGKDPAVRGWKVVESLKERVDNLKKLMPLIADLRNPAMRERHWKSLMEEVGKVFDPHSDDFTLDAVLQLGFDQHEETIGTLSNAAGKELAIEEAIAKIEVQWEELALDLAEYKEYLKLRSVDDLYSNPNPTPNPNPHPNPNPNPNPNPTQVDDLYSALEDNAVGISTMKAPSAPMRQCPECPNAPLPQSPIPQ